MAKMSKRKKGGGCALKRRQYEWMTPPEPIAEGEIARRLSADVVIVGAGHAGSCAARAAAEGGASVLVLEKQKGQKTQAIMGNEVGVLNSEFGLVRGVPRYDPMEFQLDWQVRTQNRTNPDLIRKFARRSGEVMDWFLRPLSQDFLDTIRLYMTPPPEAYLKDYSYSGFRSFLGTHLFYEKGYRLPDALRATQDEAMAHGTQFFYGRTACQTVKTDGRVTGVIAKNADGEYELFEGARAVVLAAGDCNRNGQMVHDLYQELAETFGEDADLRGMGLGDGSGIQMGIWAGGHIQPGPRAAMSPSLSFMAGGFSGTAFLRLNRLGKRYGNEGIMGAFGAGLLTNLQPEGFISAVFDSDYLAELYDQAPDHTNVNVRWPEILARMERDMADIRAAGTRGEPMHGTTNLDDGDKKRSVPFYCADTLEELGACLGYEGQTLENFLRSIARYNELCALGRDEDYCKDPRQMHAITKPPFYGCSTKLPIPIGPMATLSGVMVDENQQVIDDHGDPIPGLYATGNNSGGRFAIQYSTPIAGVSIGMAMTLGKLLGDHLAGQNA